MFLWKIYKLFGPVEHLESLLEDSHFEGIREKLKLRFGCQGSFDILMMPYAVALVQNIDKISKKM